MIVKVTQEHIDKGKWRDSFNCPISLALKDTFKVETVSTGYLELRIGSFPEDNLIFSKTTPEDVKDVIVTYDMFRKIEPFEFELSLEGVKL